MALALTAFSLPASQADVPSNAYAASLNYTLACQGCHMVDGSGYPGRVPDFRGQVARYLAVPEGRAYLAQVPGSAQSILSSKNLAEVLNWIVRTYDPQHLPSGFVPYQEREVARLRREPQSAGEMTRARILAQLGATTPESAGDSSASMMHISTTPPAATPAPQAPAAFALCAACHTVSPGGEHSIGPNLRAVVGRRAGTAPGFAYSKPMRESGIVWTTTELDAYLTDSGRKVPGTLMAVSGLPEAADRKAVIEYLAQLATAGTGT